MNINVQMSPFMRFLFAGVGVAILLVAMGYFAPFLNPVILALFLAIIFTPIFQWLQRKGLPAWLAMIIMIVVTTVIGVGLIAFLFISFRQLAESLSSYQGRLEEIKLSVQSWLASQGINPSDIQFLDFFDTEQLISWIAGFLSSLSGFAATAGFVAITILFAMLDAGGFQSRLRLALGADNPAVGRFNQFGNSLVRYILMRTIVNLITGTAVAIMLLIMGIDFAVLWGVLTFFLSYVPYVGIFIATIPSVLLALVQYGVGAAVIVILGVTIINISAENLVAPKIIGKGLSISPLIVFLSFFFWSWLLGPLGMFLSMPITVLLLYILNSFDETRWLTIVFSAGSGPPESTASSKPAEQPEQQPEGKT